MNVDRAVVEVTHLSEVDGESAEVRDDGSAEQHVSRYVEILFTELASVHRPAFLLAAETAYQLLGTIQLLRTDVDVLLELLLLLRHRFELVVQRLQLVRHLGTRARHGIRGQRRKPGILWSPTVTHSA